MPVERIAVKGSAAAAVRMNLYRKVAKDAAWIKQHIANQESWLAQING